MNQFSKTAKGFTLIELILVIGVFSLIFSSATVVFGDMIGRNSLKYHAYQLVQNLREARMNSLVQKNDAAWGIYLNNMSSPNSYTFFKGDTYLTRDSAYDLAFELPEVVNFSQLNLSGSSEVVFSRSSGVPLVSGHLVLSTDTEDYTIYINSLGLIDFNY